GIIVPPLGWLRAVRAICDELEVLMIADEVITGFGRTGRWFAVEHEGVVPDLMSVAKGITSGYVPLSASIARRHLADAFPDDSTQENVHPNTYAAHPVACAAGLANLRIMEQDHLVENAAAMGTRLLGGLRAAVGKRAIVGDVRGRGLLAAVELVEPDGSGRALDAKRVGVLDRKAWDRGAIVYARGSALRLAPPLSITAALSPTPLLTLLVPAAVPASPEGQLTWAVHVSLAPTWFDPAETTGIITPFLFLYALHDALVKPMPGNPMAPSLAESWTVSPDGLSYDFVLRRGVTFHNGDPLTAEDVKFSIERYRGAASGAFKTRIAGGDVI